MDALFENPLVSIKEVQEVINLIPKTTSELINLFVENGILLSHFKQMKMKIDFYVYKCECRIFTLFYYIIKIVGHFYGGKMSILTCNKTEDSVASTQLNSCSTDRWRCFVPHYFA